MIKKRQVDKITSQIELNKGNNKEYNIKAICKNKVSTKKLDSGYL